MNVFVVSCGVSFAVLSTLVLAYISMATMIGPWIAPTLVLLAGILLKLRRKHVSKEDRHGELAIIQAIGSVGGAVGMAIGFSLPTLYFLDKEQFLSWLSKPSVFCLDLAAITLAAGGLGILLARLFSERFIYKDKHPFPVSNLIVSVITSQSQKKEAKKLVAGLSLTGLFCFLRDGLFSFHGWLPKMYYVLPSILGRQGALALFPGPTLWAIGFIAGTVITLPLLVGMASRYLVLYPLNHHATYLPFALFEPMGSHAFSLAFCSGLVLSGFILGLQKYPKIIISSLKGVGVSSLWQKFSLQDIFRSKNNPGAISIEKPGEESASSTLHVLEMGIVFTSCVAILTYLGFGVLSQIFILSLVVMATYQISVLGARMGLVPFGRFATFVMVPTMLLFNINYMQITLLCVFVNVCSGVASDLLFDYKVGSECNVPFSRVHRYQWLGLLVVALSVGAMLWLLFNHFELGSTELCAQRGKSRALLIQSTSFNYIVLALGFVYGWVMKKCRVNPALMLGGILMPNSISIGLILGGVLSKVMPKPQSQIPFWSGVFACESLWILICMLLKLAGF